MGITHSLPPNVFARTGEKQGGGGNVTKQWQSRRYGTVASSGAGICTRSAAPDGAEHGTNVSFAGIRDLG